MQNFNFNAEMRVVIMQITDNRLTILTLDYYTFWPSTKFPKHRNNVPVKIDE